MKRNTNLPWLAAVALSVAALTGTPAVASTVNDYPEDSLRFAYVAAYRYEGDQPVDLYAEVRDAEGSPVEGATITVDISTMRSAQPLTVHLLDKGNGVYAACDAAYLDGASDADVYVFTATKDRMHPAEEKVKSDRGNLCGEGRPQILIASVQAAKLDGERQPLSVLVELVDDGGNAVSDAKVLIQVRDLETSRNLYLTELGNGRYGDCKVAVLSTEGPGQINVMVEARAQGYRSATAWTENTVGYLCANPVQQQTTARRAR